MQDTRKSWFKPVEAGWDPRFFERYFGTPLGAALRAREEKAVYELLGSVLAPGHSILEVGCGTGNYTVPVARRCAEIFAIDSSPEMLHYLRERLRYESLINVEVQPGRLPDKLGTSKKFDGALVIGVLNYVKNLEEPLRKLASALEPGGWAIFNVPLATMEGHIYALSELANRRRAYLLSPKEIATLTKKADLQIKTTIPTGLSRTGLTLMVGATARK